MATPSIQEQIKAQGEVVRQLKKDKAPDEKASIHSIALTHPDTSAYPKYPFESHVMAVALAFRRHFRAVSGDFYA